MIGSLDDADVGKLWDNIRLLEILVVDAKPIHIEQDESGI